MGLVCDIMKKVRITDHAQTQMIERGVTRDEVLETIADGAVGPAKYERKSYRASFAHQKKWHGRFYRTKQVKVITAEEKEELVVVTVISYYF